MSDVPVYTIERQFKALREQVWQMWTNPKHLAKWYGPNVETVIHQFDAKPGGQWLNEWKSEKGSMYQANNFIEVSEDSRLVFHQHTCDCNWDVTAAAMPGWPSKFLYTVSFADSDHGTKLSVQQVPEDASDEELKGFKAMMSHMDDGWNKGFDITDGILAQLAPGAV